MNEDREYPFVDEHDYNRAYMLEKETAIMTCLEKLKTEHPEWDKQTLRNYSHWNCPSWHGYLDDPAYCDNCASVYLCDKCWGREIEGDSM